MSEARIGTEAAVTAPQPGPEIQHSASIVRGIPRAGFDRTQDAVGDPRQLRISSVPSRAIGLNAGKSVHVFV